MMWNIFSYAYFLSLYHELIFEKKNIWRDWYFLEHSLECCPNSLWKFKNILSITCFWSRRSYNALKIVVQHIENKNISVTKYYFIRFTLILLIFCSTSLKIMYLESVTCNIIYTRQYYLHNISWAWVYIFIFLFLKL